MNAIHQRHFSSTDHKLELCKLAPDDPDPIKGLIVVSLTSRDGFSVSGGNPLAIVGPSGVTIQGPATETATAAAAVTTSSDADSSAAATPHIAATAAAAAAATAEPQQHHHHHQHHQQNDALPAEWEERRTKAGRSYYVNHITKSTQWERPQVTGQHISTAAAAVAPPRKHSEPRIHSGSTMNNLSSPTSPSASAAASGAGIGTSTSLMSFANIAEDASAVVPTGSASKTTTKEVTVVQCHSPFHCLHASNHLDISAATTPANGSDKTTSAQSGVVAARRKLPTSASRQSHADDLAHGSSNGNGNGTNPNDISIDASAVVVAEPATPGRDENAINSTIPQTPEAVAGATAASAVASPSGHESTTPTTATTATATTADGRPRDAETIAQRIRKSTRNSDDAGRRRNSRNIRPNAGPSATHSPTQAQSSGSSSSSSHHNHQHRGENGVGSRMALELPNGYGEFIDLLNSVLITHGTHTGQF